MREKGDLIRCKETNQRIGKKALKVQSRGVRVYSDEAVRAVVRRLGKSMVILWPKRTESLKRKNLKRVQEKMAKN